MTFVMIGHSAKCHRDLDDFESQVTFQNHPEWSRTFQKGLEPSGKIQTHATSTVCPITRIAPLGVDHG